MGLNRMKKSNSNRISGIITHPVYRVNEVASGARGALAKFFRKILMDQKLQIPQWEILMNHYLRDPRNGISTIPADKISVRGNINKELSRTAMTWKVFCKGLRFLQYYKVDIVIHGYRKNEPVRKHYLTVNLGDPFQEGPEDEDAPDEEVIQYWSEIDKELTDGK